MHMLQVIRTPNLLLRVLLHRFLYHYKIQAWSLPRTQSTLCFISERLSRLWRLYLWISYIERQSCMPEEVHFVSDANLGTLPSCLCCLLAFYAICITLYRTFMQRHGGLSCSMAIRGYRCQLHTQIFKELKLIIHLF